MIYKITVIYDSKQPAPYNVSFYTLTADLTWEIQWTRAYETWEQIDRAAKEYFSK